MLKHRISNTFCMFAFFYTSWFEKYILMRFIEHGSILFFKIYQKESLVDLPLLENPKGTKRHMIPLLPLPVYL